MLRYWQQVLSIGSAILIIPFMLQASAASLREDAIFLQDTDNGPVLVRQHGLPYTGAVEHVDDPAVVWSHYLIDAVYNSASNTVDGYVFAGTYLNPPMEAQLFALGGGGTPEWGYAGTAFFTDAGDGAFTLAAIDEDGSGVSVSKWAGPGNGTPDWTTNFAGYGVSSYGPFAVSDDGSTIAAIAAPSGADAHLLLFDAGSSTPLIDYVATGLGFPRYVKINADGRYTAFIALATLVVFDRDSLAVRDEIPMGASNSALDISGDGSLVAYGWPSLVLMEWTGSSYQNLWSYTAGGGYYLSRIAISNDGSTMVSCWYNGPHNTIKVVVHDTSSSAPLWIYDYPTSSGNVQEVCYDIDITDDGAYFIVGSWGDDANINPEVHIFQRDNTPHIYYTVDMPGSMFSVDIANDGSYATAAGKHIHANISGRGGDIVMIDTDITGITNNESVDLSGVGASLDVYPNPFHNLIQIRYMIHDPGYTTGQEGQKPQVKIYDTSGRLVKLLYQESSIVDRRSTISWDGTDQANRLLGCGVYFVQLETQQRIVSKKIVKLE